MKKLGAWRSVLCLSAAGLIVTSSSSLHTYATGICEETSLAGISLSLDQYTSKQAKMEKLDLPLASNVIEDEKPVETEDNTTQDNSTEGDNTENSKSTKEQEPDTNEDVKADDIETEVDKKKDAEKEKETEELPVSKYENMGISIANDYVNVRKEANTDSEILGKLYRGSAATIIGRKKEWVKIKSGKVEGYINSDYLAIGFDAEELEDMFGTKWATVINTPTLRLREERSVDSVTLTLIPEGETYQVIKVYDEWVKILVDGDGEGEESTKGYVSRDYIDITVEFEEAISIEEEQAEIRRQEEAKKAEEERLRALEEQKRQQEEQKRKEEEAKKNAQSSSSNKSSSSNSSSSSSSSKSSNSSSNSQNSNSSSSSKSTAPDQSVSSGSGSEIAAYAQKFVGNAYVYGGTSLTNGADCSGFTMSVFSHFGISIPRTSRSQAGAGRQVSYDELKAGDLILYANNGTVNHVALYIGGGKVVHASNPKSGIKISTWNYRTPYTARRVVQ